MKPPIKITDEEKWKAVVGSISSYDGIFYYGVRTTGIFCRPSCKSKMPVRDNVTFFHNASEAIESGFRPCKRCRPDKRIFDPDMELIAKGKDMLQLAYNRQVNIDQITKELGVSKNYFIRLFKMHCGVTPTEYIRKIRVEKAAELLNQGELNILEVSYEAGYKSLSTFYTSFKEYKGCTPYEFKNTKGEL